MMMGSLTCRFRDLLGVSPRSNNEVLEHLRHLREPKNGTGERLVRFPWGWFEYSKLTNLVSQFDSIFIGRGYYFNCAISAPVIIDCGGNMGLSGVWFRQTYPRCAMTVYEADPNLASIIRRNLDHAGHSDVNVRNNAVWSENGEIVFSSRGDDMGRIDPQGNVTVKAIDLSAELPEQVDLMKMDIEGAEFEVFERLIQTGAINRVKNLLAEFHPSKPTKVRILKIIQSLADAGFEFVFCGDLAPWMGLEQNAATFPVVGRNRMFLQLYAWQEPKIAK